MLIVSLEWLCWHGVKSLTLLCRLAVVNLYRANDTCMLVECALDSGSAVPAETKRQT